MHTSLFHGETADIRENYFMSIDRLIVVLAIVIFILDFISKLFFHQNSEYGTFIGLMLLSTAVIRVIDNKNKK